MNPVLKTSPDISRQDYSNLSSFAYVLFTNVSAAVVNPQKCSWTVLSLFIRGGESTGEYHHTAYFDPTLMDEIIERWKNDSKVAKLRVEYPAGWVGETKSNSGALEITVELASPSSFVGDVEGLLQ